MKAIKNPFFVDALARENKEKGSNINTRLERYAPLHKRALLMGDYIQHEVLNQDSKKSVKIKNIKLAISLVKCGHWLVFRNYFTIQETKLISADFCKKHLLCPLCAMRRGSKYLKAYEEKTKIVMKENPSLKGYMVTFTVKNGPDLKERFEHLKKGIKRMTEDRRLYLSRGGKFNEFAKAEGGVYSIENKRGSGSEEWHPHIHMVWLCSQEPNQEQLRKEWKEYTGDSHIVDVTPFYGDLVDSFMEVFKYALKFSDMPLNDNWHAFQTLQGKRLVNPFGCLRGVEVPEHLEDDLLDEELPYFDLFYQYWKGAYNLERTEKSLN